MNPQALDTHHGPPLHQLQCIVVTRVMKMYMTILFIFACCALVQASPVPDMTLQERAQEAFDSMKERAEEALEYVQDAANRAIESVKATVQEAMGTAQEISKEELEKKEEELLEYGKKMLQQIDTPEASPLWS